VTIADKIIHAGDTNTAIRFPAADTVTVETAGAERLRVDSAGNVGIGATSPSANLQVSPSASGLSFRVNSPDADFRLTTSATGVNLQSAGAKALTISTNAAERMRIDASGNLGLGVTPSAWNGSFFKAFEGGDADNQSYVGFRTDANTLNIGANNFFNTSNQYVYKYNGAASRFDVNADNFAWSLASSGSSGNTITFTQAMTLDASGNLGVGTTSPSARLQANTTINTVYSSSNTLTSGAIAYIRNDSSTNATAATLRLDALGSASVAAASISAVHTGDGASALTFGTRTNASSDVAERMRIDASGNVGIGATSAGSRLQVTSATSNSVRLFNTAGNGNILDFVDQSWQAQIEGNSGNILFKTGGTSERMRIDSSGNVGIGTSSPASKLDVFDGTGTIATRTLIRARDNAQSASNVLAETKAMQFLGAANTEVGYLSFQHNQGFGEFGSVDLAAIGGSRPLRFFTNSTERARIDSSGNLLVGATSGGAKIQVEGNARFHGIQTRAGTAGSWGGNNFNLFWTGSANAELWIDTTNVGNITLSSDYRIKRSVETQTADALSRVMQLRPVTYQMADYGTLFKASDKVKEGFIAHELAEVIPSAVEGEKDDPNQIQSLRLDALVSVLTKAVQELKAEVDSLRAQLNP
jgi:hypothetical protein